MLTEREQRILDLRNEGKNLEEIAKVEGVTRERIRQIERRALFKLELKKRREEEQKKKTELTETLKGSIENVGIESLDLSVRSYNCLKRAYILTIEDLLNLTSEKFRQVRNLGNMSKIEIMEKVHEVGLHFYTDVEDEYIIYKQQREHLNTPLRRFKTMAREYINNLQRTTDTKCMIGVEKSEEDENKKGFCLQFRDSDNLAFFEIYVIYMRGYFLPQFRILNNEKPLLLNQIEDIKNIMLCMRNLNHSEAREDQLKKAIFGA